VNLSTQKLKEDIDFMNPIGVIIKASQHSVKETIDRLENFLQEHGATIYVRIDQQAELQKTGQTIPP
jgi:uncharacterized protein (DUF302 family)